MEVPRISVQEIKRLMENKVPITFLDTRNAQAWADSDEKLPAAIRVPAHKVNQYLHEIPKASTVITYCT